MMAGSDFYNAGDQIERPPEVPAHQRRAAVRYVAGKASDSADFAHLLDVLGLTVEEGK